jgi:hypothetical protein
MPQWLIDSLKNNKLSNEEKLNVINNVIAADKKHDIQSARIIPTKEERYQRFNI